MPKLILTDVDDVLLSWQVSFAQFMKQKGYILKDVASYNMDKRYGIAKEEALGLMEAFNQSSHQAFLRPLEGAVNSVRALVALGFRFVAISAVGTAPKIARLRAYNLQNHFGTQAFEAIHCVALGASKEPILRRYAYSNFFWLEDHPLHAKTGQNLGFRSILLRRNHNKDAKTSALEAQNWAEIYSFITKQHPKTASTRIQ